MHLLDWLLIIAVLRTTLIHVLSHTSLMTSTSLDVKVEIPVSDTDTIALLLN